MIDLHYSNFITPVDKGSNYVILICNKKYALTLFREHKITNSQSTTAYENCKNVSHG